MTMLQNANAIESGGYNINNSIRFRSSNSAYLSRTPSVTGNQKTFTWSGWVKRGTIGTEAKLFTAGTGSSNVWYLMLSDNVTDALTFGFFNGTNLYRLTTTQVFRDPSAWYHFVLAVDTTQATASNRVRLYVNGSEITSFGTATYPAQNTNTLYNTISTTQYIGTSPSSGTYVDGYLAEINFVDGQALTPSSFGSTNATTGVWQPKAYTGTYGTNGFYLKFSDIATTSGSNAGLGKDFSGNANYWTTNNISVTAGSTYDAMIDSPTNASSGTRPVGNYAVMNPLQKASGVTASNGNLNLSTGSSAAAKILSTIGMSSGKWYCEMTLLSGNGNYGLATGSTGLGSGVYLGDDSSSWCYAVDGNKYTSGSGAAYGATYTTNDVIGIAFDADAGTLTYYKNGTSQGTAFTSLTNGPYFFAQGASPSTAAVNFGQRPFQYTPPTGYQALCTTNLPTPTILQGNKYMDATLYTGNGSTQTITNAGAFKPDFVWNKGRSGATDHYLFDAVRGAGKGLFSTSTSAEFDYGTSSTSPNISFNSNGFTIGSNGGVNASSATYVGWQWQAGQGSTSSNTAGSITSTVSVNTTAGFSVVTYTGNGTAGATVGHGLGVTPKMIIYKRRNDIGNWIVYHTSLGNNGSNYAFLEMNTTAATQTVSSYLPVGGLSSTTFMTGTTGSINASGGTYVAHCFAAISGYSAFGSYTGNGSTDGPFTYLGFRPKFVMIKSTTQVESWEIWDTSRNTYNVTNLELFPNASNAETDGAGRSPVVLLDLLSNGFKIRGNNPEINQNGDSYIYAAFSENPFSSNNRAR